MKNIILSFLFVIGLGIFSSKAQHHFGEWTKHIDGHENSTFNNILYDGKDVVINGYWMLDASFEGIELPNFTSANALLVKMDTNGMVLWSAMVTGDGYESFYDMTFDSDKNIVVAGWSSSNDSVLVNGVKVFEPVLEWTSRAVVAKFSGVDGSLMWYKTFSSAVEYSGVNANRLALDENDNIYLAGYYDASFTVDTVNVAFTQGENYGSGPFLIKLNPQGNAIWGKGFEFVTEGYGGFGMIKTMATDKKNLYFGFEYSKPMIINDETLPYSGENYWLGIAKMSLTTGEITKVSTFGSNQGQGLARMAMDNKGDLVFTGFFIANSGFSIGGINLTGNGDREGFVAKMDTSLTTLWAKSMGGGYADQAFNVKIATNNRIFIGGGFDCYTPFKYNDIVVIDSLIPNSLAMFQIIIDEDGDFKKAFPLYGNNEYSIITYSDFIVLPNDMVFAVGSAMDSVEFKKDEFYFSDHNAGFIMKWNLFYSSDDTTAIASHKNTDLNIYPNPTNGKVNIDGQQKLLKYQIFNMVGHQVSEVQVNATIQELNLSELENGIYVLKLFTSEGNFSHKLQVIK
jgi:hypothetical protein